MPYRMKRGNFTYGGGGAIVDGADYVAVDDTDDTDDTDGADFAGECYMKTLVCYTITTKALFTPQKLSILM